VEKLVAAGSARCTSRYHNRTALLVEYAINGFQKSIVTPNSVVEIEKGKTSSS
jgi:hypothetical protein